IQIAVPGLPLAGNIAHEASEAVQGVLVGQVLAGIMATVIAGPVLFWLTYRELQTELMSPAALMNALRIVVLGFVDVSHFSFTFPALLEEMREGVRYPFWIAAPGSCAAVPSYAPLMRS